MSSSSKEWTAEQLGEEVERFKAELVASDFKEQTIENYVDRASIFVRWLDGRYDPKTVHHRD